MTKRSLFILLFLVVSGTLYSQPNRKVAVLNMNSYNSETNNSRIISSMRFLRMAGIPYDTTSSLTTALTYPVVMTGSRILENVFTPAEILQIKSYVNLGGVFISSSMRDTALFDMCGISSAVSTDTLCEMVFDTTFIPELYHDINDPMEVDVSLGDTATPLSFFTRYYGLNGATAMAQYETGTCALAYHAWGNGHVYTFGPDFRDICIRNQLDFDVNAQRVYSNGFEPTTDVFSFLLRNIVRKHIPNSAYKYTVPGTAGSVFIMTHDIDSDSGIDTMGLFSDFEATRGIEAMYNITTRYTNDGWMTSFYVGSWSEVHALLGDGQTLGSHSVGHFPDFDNETIFPLGTTGNQPPQYQPFYTMGSSTGGTVMGEVEVSKELLEDDHTVKVRSFRAGHLCYNDSLAFALMTMGYDFSSTHSANNVLSSFPFYDYDLRSFSGNESTILEIPMTLSDVFNSDPITSSNYPQKVAQWADVCERYHANHSPVVLLIHPNRTWKLTAEQMLVDSLPQGMEFIQMERYGDFWRKRDSLQFHTYINGDTLFVQMDNDKLDAEQSFVLDMNGLDTARFFDVNNTELAFKWMSMPNGRRLYYQYVPDGMFDLREANKTIMHIYPNPANGRIFIVTSDNLESGKLEVTDMSGKTVFTDDWSYGNKMVLDLGALSIQSGLYFIKYCSSDKVIVSRVVYSSPN